MTTENSLRRQEHHISFALKELLKGFKLMSSDTVGKITKIQGDFDTYKGNVDAAIQGFKDTIAQLQAAGTAIPQEVTDALAALESDVDNAAVPA